jgi:hypothetical protein
MPYSIVPQCYWTDSGTGMQYNKPDFNVRTFTEHQEVQKYMNHLLFGIW